MTDPAPAESDRKQVGLPRSHFAALEELVDSTPWFGKQLDAYRLAITVALAREFSPSASETDTFETKFSVSSLDPDGDMRRLILALSPDRAGDRPYDYAQRLAVAGVQFLHKELVEEESSLGAVLGIEELADDSD